MNNRLWLGSASLIRGLLFGLFIVPLLVSAQDAQRLSIVVPRAGKATLLVAPAWQHILIQPSPELPPTVKLTPTNGVVSLQLTFLPDPEDRFATRDDVDRIVSKANEHYVDGSVEKRLVLTQIVSTNGHGCYALFTDADLAKVAHPAKGQFRNVASGVFVLKKQFATFTLLSNDRNSSEYKRALHVVSDGISMQRPRE